MGDFSELSAELQFAEMEEDAAAVIKLKWELSKLNQLAPKAATVILGPWRAHNSRKLSSLQPLSDIIKLADFLENSMNFRHFEVLRSSDSALLIKYDGVLFLIERFGRIGADRWLLSEASNVEFQADWSFDSDFLIRLGNYNSKEMAYQIRSFNIE